MCVCVCACVRACVRACVSECVCVRACGDISYNQIVDNGVSISDTCWPRLTCYRSPISE